MSRKRKGREQPRLFGGGAADPEDDDNVAGHEADDHGADDHDWQEGDTLRPDQVRALRDVPPPPRDAQTFDSGAGDTIRMSSIRPRAGAGEAGRKPGRPKPRPRPAERVSDMPRRDYSARHRFGFVWYIVGFFGLIFRTILVTVIVMGLSGWIGFHAMKFYIKTPETTVPNVKGMKVDAALEQLATAKLGIQMERTEASGLVAPGEIINQAPLPGTRMKEKSNVRVVVSSGRASYVVPSVVDETLENATNKIRSSRLEVGNITEYPSDKPKGTVVSQSPEANKGFDSPQKVDLLVSAGQ